MPAVLLLSVVALASRGKQTPALGRSDGVLWCKAVLSVGRPAVAAVLLLSVVAWHSMASHSRVVLIVSDLVFVV